MATTKVYHNPDFLSYRGDHNQILLPAQPVALVKTPDALSPAERLEFAYMKTQHGHESWYFHPEVTALLRSTSVGDLIADADDVLHIVESFGFQPFQPAAGSPEQRLAEAHRQLSDAVGRADSGGILAAARQALSLVQQMLGAVGSPDREVPVLWEEAQPGDLVNDEAGRGYRVIARRLAPRRRAERLLAHIQEGQIRQDGEQAWAVLTPEGEETPA